MASGSWWSRMEAVLDAIPMALLRRSIAVFNRAPRPVRQTWRLVLRTLRGAAQDRVPGLAAEAALFSLISLPALLLAILGSLGFIAETLGPAGTEALRQLVLEVPEAFLSERTFAAYEQTVEAMLAQRRGSVISIGILLSLWTGSRAMHRYLETIAIAYGVSPRRLGQRRLLALGLTVAGLLGAVALLPPLVLGPDLIESMAPPAVAAATLHVLDLLFWPAVGVLVLLGLATLYHLGAPWHTPWRRDLPGAVLAMALWLAAAAALRAYLAFSVQDDAAYSQLAVPIAVVLWLYLTALAVLLGAEVNAVIEKMWPHERHPWRLRRRTAEDSQ
ncbi:YihY/virulence factor BrkB family protein [Mycolicibacterium chitae]|uniref:Ribonuclease BN-related protein n=1 Tax=Mycolicibacterium chitae TaxID=1792 RepID=A0A3S4RP36_MYCCI|nr:YihY/virulence factor BrkB family protein [Mycolicibacterium chitae]MCV7106204.1 YihY/virulence factor BrkB family protein [Mycolicibacterium chitae]VEG48961.1 Ribonuclease BN-related protein [Mycolicibacterium chitae]